MAWGTTYSRNACKWMVNGGGISTLFKFIRSCNRSEPHQAMLLSILKILDNILRYSEKVMPIDPSLLAKGISILCENLQYFRYGASHASRLVAPLRLKHCAGYDHAVSYACDVFRRDNEMVFTQMVLVLKRMCSRPGVPELVDGLPRIVSSLDGICRVLVNRLKMEGQYLTKLEVKKGSDASASIATRRLISTSNQLKSLQALLTQMHDAVCNRPRHTGRESVFDSGHPGTAAHYSSFAHCWLCCTLAVRVTITCAL
jgi:abnormal spindle-like microcephaly-associated protein